MTNKQVVFANDEVSIHMLITPEPNVDALGNESYNIESKVLLPGQFVEKEQLPPYLLNAVKEGAVSGLEIMTESRAKKVSAEAEKIRSLESNTIDTTSHATKVKNSVEEAEGRVVEEPEVEKNTKSE